MSLQDWLNNGWLIEHQASGEEIGDLLGVVDRDLADSQTPGLSADWRLSIAYNAAIQAASAALAAAGYRAARQSHHHRVIQSLAYTVGVAPRLVAQLDAFRKKRNIGEYERAGRASDQEAEEILALARKLRGEVDAWLRDNHPRLL
jgi:hypothetical protein